MRSRRKVAVAAVAAFCGMVGAAPASSASLTLGLGDPIFDGPQAGPWLQRAAAAGASDVRLTLSWAAVAPTRPDRPEDPASTAYAFAATDAAVRAASAAGRRVLLLVSGAPAWAEGDDRPEGVNAGTWRPDPAAFGAFMEAVAQRYDGSFDPGDGAGRLPRVAAFQLWNEPNLPVYLTPQWSSATGTSRPASPLHYRRMANAAYPRIKAASPRALVVMAGTAPYGDPVTGGARMPPARFVRELLCLRGSAIQPRPAGSCADPVHLDVLSHHPYGVGSPFEGSYWPDDVSLGDLDRLTRAFAVARRAKYLLPARKTPFWVTEFGWESKPDPTGLPQARQSRWLGEATLQLHRSGVSRAFWYRVHDDAPVPSWGRSVQSGLFDRAERAKLAAAAFRFPVAAVRRSAGGATVFALPPTGGTCRIQRVRGGRWTTVASGRCRARRGFSRTVRGGGKLRVTLGSERSPTVTAPR